MGRPRFRGLHEWQHRRTTCRIVEQDRPDRRHEVDPLCPPHRPLAHISRLTAMLSGPGGLFSIQLASLDNSGRQEDKQLLF